MVCDADDITRNLKSKIVGGEQSENGQFPYYGKIAQRVRHGILPNHQERMRLIFLLFFPTTQAQIQFGCAGALIAPDIVLSTAHCERIEGDFRGSQVLIGAYESGVATETTHVRFCEQWIPDPLFERNSNATKPLLNYDFAICKLDRPVEIDTSTVTIEMNDLDSVPSVGDDLIAMGLGLLRFTKQPGPNDIPQFLRDVTVPYFDTDACNATESYNGRLTEAMFCAGLPEGGKDACLGDSGGPLVKRSITDGKIVDKLVGLISWGVECANPNTPGIYSRISTRFDWIKTTICDDLQSIAPFCDNEPPADECDGEELVIKVLTDFAAQETVWTLKTSRKDIVARANYFVSDYEYEHKVCLKADECYKLNFKDSFGDGFECFEEGCEAYSGFLNGEEIFKGKGKFKFRNKEKFCTLPLCTEAPSSSPTSLTAQPTPEDVCEDNEEFRWNGKNRYTCEFYLKPENGDRKIRKKCENEYQGQKVYKWCPKTCGERVNLGPCSDLGPRECKSTKSGR